MLAAVCYGREDVRIEAGATREPGPDEVRVAVSFGGICGSDIHYYRHGAVGDFALREPMVLGHEVSGVILDVGSNVKGLVPGTRAALDPSRPCLACRYCRSGRSNLCTNMQFLGSAARSPHVQGGFAQQLVLRHDQVVPVADEVDLLQLSVAEPLSVALHAVNRAGPLLGTRVIVAGSGPIGLLTARAAGFAGAQEVVSTDIEDGPLEVARLRMGASRTINVASQPEALVELAEHDSGAGYFDVAFEASGAASALTSLFPVLRAGGRIVQIGMMPRGSTPLPVNALQSREISLLGAFRASNEFRDAVDLIVSGAIDVSPILSGIYPLEQAALALERAGDRSSVVKLHLSINEDPA